MSGAQAWIPCFFAFFPGKSGVIREFRWRRVRSRLRPPPASSSPSHGALDICAAARKGPVSRAFQAIDFSPSAPLVRSPAQKASRRTHILRLLVSRCAYRSSLAFTSGQTGQLALLMPAQRQGSSGDWLQGDIGGLKAIKDCDRDVRGYEGKFENPPDVAFQEFLAVSDLLDRASFAQHSINRRNGTKIESWWTNLAPPLTDQPLQSTRLASWPGPG